MNNKFDNKIEKLISSISILTLGFIIGNSIPEIDTQWIFLGAMGLGFIGYIYIQIRDK